MLAQNILLPESENPGGTTSLRISVRARRPSAHERFVQMAQELFPGSEILFEQSA